VNTRDVGERGAKGRIVSGRKVAPGVGGRGTVGTGGIIPKSPLLEFLPERRWSRDGISPRNDGAPLESTVTLSMRSMCERKMQVRSVVGKSQ
jgi:hypothetical protein